MVFIRKKKDFTDSKIKLIKLLKSTISNCYKAIKV